MDLRALIERRFGLPSGLPETIEDYANPTLRGLLERRSRRRFRGDPVAEELLQTLFAAAFSAPSKSDLQQACVIRIDDRDKQRRLAAASPKVAWIADAPVFMVWCGDGRRIVRAAARRGHPFANDHLDAFMNAAVDAGIALSAFIVAAESVGLGCCPVSEIRDHIDLLSAELALPERVFPVAGLCVGWPADAGAVSMRLPPAVTVHRDRYCDDDLDARLADYDRRREAREATPAERQRLVERFGVSDDYGWSENRGRQYALPMREDFGRYVRRQGFKLD